MAEIYSLVYTPYDERRQDRYTRIPMTAVKLVAGHGIEGDLNGGSSPDRNLNVMTYETLAALGEEGFRTQPGEMGEQIAVRGLDINALPVGSRVQFGDHAVIEVVKPRTGCDRFEAIQGRSRMEVQDRLGVMARVIADGEVRVGDPVTVLQAVSE